MSRFPHGRAAASAAWPRLAMCLLFAASFIGTVGVGRAARAADEAASPAPDGDDAGPSSRARVPPVPDGTPAELLEYIHGLTDPDRIPTSGGRRRYYLRKALANTVEAADKILARLEPAGTIRGEVVRLKFDALSQLAELGDRRAADLLAEFAASLADGADEGLAARARGVAARAEIDALVADGRVADAPALVRRLAGLLESAPDDAALAEAAAGLAAKLERAPDGEAAARLAYETFVPLFEKSANERITDLARRLAGSLRLLTLTGNAMELEGRLLDGAAFDQQSLAGKVVLVDFWATWCGPCVAEIANIRAQYDRYHDRGFEVVGISLDRDRAALERFVADRGIPWQIVVDEDAAAGGGPTLADRYGIRGIPQCILVGRDGRVISTTARGRRLEALLAEQFPAVPDGRRATE